MGAELRTWFFRDLVDCLFKLRPNANREVLRERLPDRLRRYLDAELLNDIDPAATVPLDDAEELLLALDLAVGDGSGRSLEDACSELVSRGIVRGVVPIQQGDFLASCQRLQAVIERPFVNASPFFEFQRTETGFTLSVGIVGRPRSARVLRHWSLGALRATARFVQQARYGELRLYADTVGDRANIMGRFTRASSDDMPAVTAPEPPARAPTRKPSRPPRASTQGGLSAEVDRILSSAAARRDSTGPISRPRVSDVTQALRPPRVPQAADQADADAAQTNAPDASTPSTEQDGEPEQPEAGAPGKIQSE